MRGFSEPDLLVLPDAAGDPEGAVRAARTCNKHMTMSHCQGLPDLVSIRIDNGSISG